MLRQLQLEHRSEQLTQLQGDPADPCDHHAGRRCACCDQSQHEQQDCARGRGYAQRRGIAEDPPLIGLRLRDVAQGDRIEAKIEHRAGKQQQCQNRAIPAEAGGTDGAREQTIGDDPKQQPGNLGADRAAQVVEQREVQRHRAPAARAGHERLHEEDSGGEGRANGPVDAGFARTQADGGLTVAPTLLKKHPTMSGKQQAPCRAAT